MSASRGPSSFRWPDFRRLRRSHKLRNAGKTVKQKNKVQPKDAARNPDGALTERVTAIRIPTVAWLTARSPSRQEDSGQ